MKAKKTFQKDLAQKRTGLLSDETCFCVHTLTSIPFPGAQSCNTTGVKVTNLFLNINVQAGLLASSISVLDALLSNLLWTTLYFSIVHY